MRSNGYAPTPCFRGFQKLQLSFQLCFVGRGASRQAQRNDTRNTGGTSRRGHAEVPIPAPILAEDLCSLLESVVDDELAEAIRRVEEALQDSY